MSISKQGIVPWNIGLKTDPVVRDKLSKAHLGKKKPRTIEHQNKLNELKSKLYMVELPSGQLIQIKNLTKFCKERGIDRRNLYLTLGGQRKTTKNYRLLEKVNGNN